jgi:hypothetical protein
MSELQYFKHFTVATATNFAVGTGPESIITADFNGDGKMDLATANYISNNLTVLINNGLGSFSAATNFSVGTAPISIVSDDFNGDGKMDLVTTNANSSNVSVLLNYIPIVTASESGFTLTANQNGATYQWIDCNNGNTPISGQTNQSFTATGNGNYAVIVTQNNCSDTSSCYNIVITGIVENRFASAVTIYPNPSTEVINILGEAMSTVEVLNSFGQTIIKVKGTNTIDISGIAKGLYFIEVSNDRNEVISISKIIKE